MWCDPVEPGVGADNPSGCDWSAGRRIRASQALRPGDMTVAGPVFVGLFTAPAPAVQPPKAPRPVVVSATSCCPGCPTVGEPLTADED